MKCIRFGKPVPHSSGGTRPDVTASVVERIALSFARSGHRARTALGMRPPSRAADWRRAIAGGLVGMVIVCSGTAVIVADASRAPRTVRPERTAEGANSVPSDPVWPLPVRTALGGAAFIEEARWSTSTPGRAERRRGPSLSPLTEAGGSSPAVGGTDREAKGSGLVREGHQRDSEPRRSAWSAPDSESGAVSRDSERSGRPAEETATVVGRWVLVALAVSMVPPLLLLTTCYLRFAIVFGLLRHALGGSFLPPNLVVHGLCLALSFVVMEPVWRAAYQEGIGPFLSKHDVDAPLTRPTAAEALQATAGPIRRFMQQQIQRAGNAGCVAVLLRYRQAATRRSGSAAGEVDPRGQSTDRPRDWESVPFSVLLSAYVLSELTVALQIGVRLLVPFMAIDLFVASVLTGLGLAPSHSTWVALPLKLIVFLAVDGWNATVGMVLHSVGAVGS